MPGTETAPGTELAVAEFDTPQDREMCAQLEAEGEFVKTASLNVTIHAVIHGVMGIKLREYLLTRASESKHVGSGRYPKNSGIKAWLKATGCKVCESTLYDHIALAEGLQREFRLSADTDLPALLNGDTKDLSAKLQKTAQKIRDFLKNRSARQLQLVFGNKPVGGHHPKQGPAKPWSDPDGYTEEQRAACDVYLPMMRLMEEHAIRLKDWCDLPDKEMKRFKGILIDLNKMVPDHAPKPVPALPANSPKRKK